jgi:hypothetical protein|tara:strand:+ start:1106 stop:1330 length:225 start_codon:yes stop_codon:yes gene_type:complete
MNKTIEYLEAKVIRAEAKYVKDLDDLTKASPKYWDKRAEAPEFWDADEALAESMVRIKRLKALILELKEQDNVN